MVSINWTYQAADDLKNISDFIAVDSHKFSKIHIKRIKERVNILKNFPLSGRIVPEVKNENIRELIFGNYRIIYRFISDERVDILTVFHSSRILKL